MGTTCVSVYPYQLGHDNEEAIESGAFWFYRKLGFRSGRADLQRLVEREEQKIAANRNYRTSARMLKRFAAGHVFYELPGSELGAWDTFSTRNIGLRVNRHMARHFSGDSARIRQESVRAVARILAVNPASWTNLEQTSFDNFAVVLALVPDLSARRAQSTLQWHQRPLRSECIVGKLYLIALRQSCPSSGTFGTRQRSIP